MALRTWIRRLFDRKPRTIRKEPVHFLPWLQVLEDRVMLSASPPTVITGAAGAITTSSALVQATVNPNGSSTTARFQYSTDPSFPLTVTTALGSGFRSPSKMPECITFDMMKETFPGESSAARSAPMPHNACGK